MLLEGFSMFYYVYFESKPKTFQIVTSFNNFADDSLTGCLLRSLILTYNCNLLSGVRSC